MEETKRSSVFGKVLIVIVLAGILIYYFAQRNTEIAHNQNTEIQNEVTTESTEVEASLEAEVNSFDSDFSDMQAEDINI